VTPSNAEYIGENRISIWLLAQVVTEPTVPGWPPGESDFEQAALAAASARARQAAV
jgi:hypothetical protein